MFLKQEVKLFNVVCPFKDIKSMERLAKLIKVVAMISKFDVLYGF